MSRVGARASIFLLLAACAAGLTASPLRAAPEAATPQASAAKADKALTLAKVMNPEWAHLVIKPAQRAQMMQGFQADPEVAAMEKEFPGIIAAIWSRIEPVALAQVKRSLPTLWADVARHLDTMLTESEIDGLLVFYRSPTGQKLLRAVNESADYRALGADVIGDGTIGREAITTAAKRATATVSREMTSADQAAFMTLSKSISFERFQRIAPGMQRIQLAWLNTSDSGQDAELERVTEAAIAEYMEKNGHAD